ncbi:amidohydrolase 3 [Hyaloraphidium curvatum]|nr:amidohydrolase 3 [Hyaloraphidium curvatum]
MESPADLILINGKIRTLPTSADSDVEALAVRGGRVALVGSSADANSLRGPATRVVDLDGRRAVPGLIDGHCHGVKASIYPLFSCSFAYDAGPKEIEAALAAFAEKNPSTEFVMGGRYPSTLFDDHAAEFGGSPRAWLDARSHGRIVYLREDSGHNGWANSRALEFLGISRDSPDPRGGKIVRGADGEPNGLLNEEADVSARLAWPDWTAEQYRKGVQQMAKTANSFGITGVTDADANEGILRALKAVDDAEGLTVRVVAAQTTPYGHREVPLDYSLHEKWRDAYAAPHVHTEFVKIYLDGVPLSDSRSACMLEPYLPDPQGRFADDHHGSVHVGHTVLAQDLAELDRRNFTVKVHCCGDGAVRATLDAVEAARKANGPSGPAHEVAHCCFVGQGDLPRFRELNAIAEVSPYLWGGNDFVRDIGKCVSAPVVERLYPFRELRDAGAQIMAGSDWPAGVTSMNPWSGLGTMVTRAKAGDVEGTTRMQGAQTLSVEEALQAFTAASARGLGAGTLEVGKWADIAVLDRDIFAVPAHEVAGTKAVMTFFEGKLVYAAHAIPAAST